MPRLSNATDRPTKLKLLLRRQKKLLRPAAYVAAGAVLLLFLAMLVRSADPSNFAGLREGIGSAAPMRVQSVMVEGRKNTPDALLRAAIGVARGDPLLGFSVERARQRIESLAWVEQATVERRLPGTILVTLRERRAFAIWQKTPVKFVLIDRAGDILAEDNLAPFAKFPLVVGPGAPTAAAPLIDVLAAYPNLTERMTAAVRVGERRWNLKLKNGADILLPEGAESAAIAKLMELQASNDLLDRPLQTVDMRLPDRMVIRPQEKAETKAPPPGKRPT